MSCSNQIMGRAPTVRIAPFVIIHGSVIKTVNEFKSRYQRSQDWETSGCRDPSLAQVCGEEGIDF